MSTCTYKYTFLPESSQKRKLYLKLYPIVCCQLPYTPTPVQLEVMQTSGIIYVSVMTCGKIGFASNCNVPSSKSCITSGSKVSTCICMCVCVCVCVCVCKCVCRVYMCVCRVYMCVCMCVCINYCTVTQIYFWCVRMCVVFIWPYLEILQFKQDRTRVDTQVHWSVPCIISFQLITSL